MFRDGVSLDPDDVASLNARGRTIADALLVALDALPWIGSGAEKVDHCEFRAVDPTKTPRYISLLASTYSQ